MILKKNFNEHSKEIWSWIEGANDAISKKYIDKICFSIHSQIDHELLESYTFCISYQNDDKSPSPQISLSRDNDRNKNKNRNKNENDNHLVINDEKSLQKNIDLFYRKITFALTYFNSIPDDKEPICEMRLKFNKSAPDDYQPLNFQNKNNDSPEFQFLFKKKPENKNVGQIKTKYHSASLHVKSLDAHYKDRDDQNEDESENEIDQDSDLEIYDPFQIGDNDEIKVMDATSSLTIKSKENRPKILRNHMEINPDSSNSSSNSSSDSNKSNTSSTNRSNSGAKRDILPSLENSTNSRDSSNTSDSENQNSDRSSVESDHQINSNNKIKKRPKKRDKKLNEDKNQDSEQEKDKEKDRNVSKTKKRQNRKRKRKRRALEESQDIDEQDININVDESDDHKKTKKKNKRRISISRNTKRNKKSKSWKKGDIALRNGEAVEIVKYFENDDHYEVKKANGEIVNTIGDKLTEFESTDNENDEQETEENDEYQDEPPKKRQKTFVSSSSDDVETNKMEEMEEMDDMMKYIMTNNYESNEELDDQQIMDYLGFDSLYRDNYKSLCDKLVKFKILVKDKKNGQYKTSSNYKKKYKKIAKNIHAHIAERDSQ